MSNRSPSNTSSEEVQAGPVDAGIRRRRDVAIPPTLRKGLIRLFGKHYQDIVPIVLKLLRTKQYTEAAVRAIVENINRFRREHPYLARAIGTCLILGGGIVVAQGLFAALLPVLGFGTLGPIAGTLAPLIQSIIYGASTGGLFSLLQAAGMTFVGPPLLAVIGAGGVMGVGRWLWRSVRAE